MHEKGLSLMYESDPLYDTYPLYKKTIQSTGVIPDLPPDTDPRVVEEFHALHGRPAVLAKAVKDAGAP
jgi:hypothetical protein